MDVNNRKAPKRQVVSITKTGEWGNYAYNHLLDCGHIETRKRAAATEVIACAWCVRAAAKAEDLASLKAPQWEPDETFDMFLLESEDQKVEADAAKIKAGLAARLQIPLDAVDVIVAVDLTDPAGRLTISSAVIYLSGDDAQRIAIEG